QLSVVGKTFPGAAPSLRGTKLETLGPALWLRNLSRAARLTAVAEPSVTALQEVSLAIQPGEVFGILGANGSGKTTLVKIVAGLLRPSQGSGQVAGWGLDQSAQIRRRVSYVSTTGWMGLEWALTAEENIRFFAHLCGMSGTLARQRTTEALADVELLQDRHKAISELSNGMRQRVILARALLFRTPLVLLDEPTVGLDPIHRSQMLHLVRQTLPARGQTVILVDHQADALEGVLDRAAILEAGRVQRIGTPRELVSAFRGIRVLELLTRGGEEPPAPAPALTRQVVRTARPGPLAVTHWRVQVAEHPAALETVLAWVLSGGGEVVQVSERGPSLADLLTEHTIHAEAEL
ncbi:MAG: ABC transporter ATP-binding protein, partial [Sulfobacillus sp.]